MQLSQEDFFTSEVFAHRRLQSSCDAAFVAWAENMVLSGFESEHLYVLLGEKAPFNGSEMDALLDRIHSELRLPEIVTDEEAVRIIATAKIRRFVDGMADCASTLFSLAELYRDEADADAIFDFFALQNAAVDLEISGHQHYWPGATSANIDDIIKARCIEWLKTHPFQLWQRYEWQR